MSKLKTLNENFSGQVDLTFINSSAENNAVVFPLEDSTPALKTQPSLQKGSNCGIAALTQGLRVYAHDKNGATLKASHYRVELSRAVLDSHDNTGHVKSITLVFHLI